MGFDEAFDFFESGLWDEVADGIEEGGCGDGEEVRAGEVAVVVGVLLGAHHLGFPEFIVPAAGGLHLGDAGVEFFGLALDFVVDCAADGGEGVEVFQFDLGAEGIGFFCAQ